MQMRPFDVLCNLKNWTSWDYKAYKLSEEESKPCIKALESYIWHPVNREGLPKKEGTYLVATIHGLNILEVDSGDMHYYLIDDVTPVKDVIAWRYVGELYEGE